MVEAASGGRLGTVLFYGVVLLLAYLVFRIFEPFLVPLGWACVLVVVFHPWHARLEKRWGRASAAAVSTLGVTLILIVPTLLLMTLFVRDGVEAARSLQRAVAGGQYPSINRAWEWVVQRAPGGGPEDLSTLVRQSGERMAQFLATELGTLLRNAAAFLFELFVTLFALFYLFRDAGSILAGIRRVLPFEEPHREKMIAEARDLIFASVTTSLIIAAVQGLLGGTAFALVHLRAPVFWGVVIAFFSLLPVVGAWPVWLPATIWLFATGHPGRGLVVVALCAGVGTTVDNFLRPLLIGGRARLSGLLVFISVLGGISVFGMLGVVLGPIVVATVAGILDVYTLRERAA
jgi:predicted PurR-regulated permease PerM